MTDTLSAARAFTDAGLCVIPIKADGTKSPDLPAWKPFQERRPTGDELRGWFGNGTRRGVAVVWGRVSGNAEVLDFDEPGLFERYAALCAEQGHGALIESMPLVETPSGGRHLYYRCSGPVQGNQKLAQRLTDGKRETLIETRGEGGYALAPGSPDACHPENRPYKFLHLRPRDIPTITPEDRAVLLALAGVFNEYAEPSQVVDGPPFRQQRGGEGLRPGDDYSRRGDYEALLERHGWHRHSLAGDKGLWRRPGKDGHGISATSNYAGSGLFYVFSSNAVPFEPQRAYSPFTVYTLLEHGGDYSEAAKDLAAQGFGDQRQPGVPSAPAGSGGHTDTPGVPAPVLAWEPPVPFDGCDLPPFPVEALPPALGDYIASVAETIQVPPDMPALLALAVVAAAGSRSCRVQIGTTHAEPLNLYAAAVMEPGSRKSAAMAAMAFPLEEAERALRAAREDGATERAVLVRELEALAAELADVPAAPRLLADDVTPEQLGTLMHEQGGCMALFSAEGGVFGILAGRYSGKGDVNMDLFLKGHVGDPVRVDRKGRPAEHIPYPCLTVGLTVQPDVLASLSDTPSFRGRGLLGRFLYALPAPLVGTRCYNAGAALDDLAKHRYGRAVRAVLALPSPATPEEPEARHPLRLCGEALTLWAEYADDVERRQLEGGDLVGIREWASKLAGAVARIAGGLHLAGHAGEPYPWNIGITPETVAAAWAIGEYLIPHAKAAFGIMGADPRLAMAKRILAWVKRAERETFTLRDCHQAHRGLSTVTAPSDLLPALEVLSERGFIRAEGPPHSGPGRKPGPIFRVSPYA